MGGGGKREKERRNGMGSREEAGSDGEREIIVKRVSDTRRNTLDITRRGWMTMFPGSGAEFLSAKQVNSGFANSVTTDGYAARGNDSASS